MKSHHSPHNIHFSNLGKPPHSWCWCRKEQTNPLLTSLSGLARQTNRGDRLQVGLASSFREPGTCGRSGIRDRGGGSGEEGSGAGLQGPGGEWAGPGRDRGGKGLWIDGPRGGAAEGSGLGVGPDRDLGVPSRIFPRPKPCGRARTCALGARLRPPMAAAAGLRAFRAKVPDWLRRGRCVPLAAGFCSRGPAGAGQPEPGSRLTSSRQRDGIRSGSRLAGLFPGGPGWRGTGGGELGQRPPGTAPATPRGVPRGRRPLPWTPLSGTAGSGPRGGPVGRNRGCGT